MNFFGKSLFIFILFFSYNVFGRLSTARNLMVRTLNGNPTRSSINELEQRMRPFIEEVYGSNKDNFVGGAGIKVIRDMVGDPSLSDANFRAALYSVSIRILDLNEYPRDPYFYLMADFILALKNNSPERVSELTDIISSPYFSFPLSLNDFNNYKQMIFEYVGRNFRHIHEGGHSNAIFLKWWDQKDFRKIVFHFIQREQLDDSDIFLKWWKEDKKMGSGRFTSLVVPYFVRVRNGKAISNDDFWEAIFRASKENDEFAREMDFIFEKMREPVGNWTTEMIRGLPPREFERLSFEETQAFTRGQISVLNPQQRRALFRIHRNN